MRDGYVMKERTKAEYDRELFWRVTNVHLDRKKNPNVTKYDWLAYSWDDDSRDELKKKQASIYEQDASRAFERLTKLKLIKPKKVENN